MTTNLPLECGNSVPTSDFWRRSWSSADCGLRTSSVELLSFTVAPILSKPQSFWGGANMKVKVLARSEDEFTRERRQDLQVC